MRSRVQDVYLGGGENTKRQQDLSELLAQWHAWAKGWGALERHATSAMFTGVRSSRQWDSENDIAGNAAHHATMEALDFHVNELSHLWRTALLIQARNLYTGRSVWVSARLPSDPAQRTAVLVEARSALIARLVRAGVL